MKTFDYKVPGGKLIRLKIEIMGNRISSIQILGDFFLHPEETIYEIERVLVGVEVQREQILASMSDAIRHQSAELVGASLEDFVQAILLASETREQQD
jgi:lipoate-protein ligase A